MGECSTLNPVTPLCMSLPSGSGLCGMKRSHSSDDSDGSSSTSKVCKYDNRRLIDSPVRHTDSGSETELTCQEEETDLCCRSTESSSDWSERNAVGRVEYEVRSPNEAPNPFGDSSTASDASVNALQVIGLPPPKIWDEAGDSSCASSGSSEVFDPEIPRRDYWTCMQCSSVNNRPAFRYCEKCYKVRRDMFQPRVKPRKRRKRKISKGAVTGRKANSERSTGANNMSGATVNKSVFSGVKLQACSQENRDSGVASCSQSSGFTCSQSTFTSVLPVSGKDSDSSQSTDSAADTRDFHGVKLVSTRVAVNSLASVMCRGTDVVESFPHTLYRNSSRTGSVPRTLCQGVDEVDAVRPSTSRGGDEVDAVRPSTSRGGDEVDAVRPSTSRGVDEVDAVRLSTSRGVDEVDAVRPSTSRGVDEVNAVRPSTSRGVDEVDAVRPSTSRGVDEVDAVQSSTSRGIDEVDSVRPLTTQSVDNVESVWPTTSRGVDVVDPVWPSTSRDIDEVDCARTSKILGPSKIRSLDEVDSVRRISSGGVEDGLVRSGSSQDIGEIDSLQQDFTQCVDEVNLMQQMLSQSVDDNDTVSHNSRQTVDEVDSAQFALARGVNKASTSKLHSVKTQTDLCFISKSDLPNEQPVVDVDKCMTCYSRSLDGIFIHSMYAHMCCCYKCTVRVWKTTKRCPLCNCKVKNVLRLFKAC